ncbi:MAG: glycoside hydrolase family 92 protein, partial [Bacteroidia bacterium]|nr:glycoside hydrolase family 92 protein [Bacteroidia bacterium]
MNKLLLNDFNSLLSKAILLGLLCFNVLAAQTPLQYVNPHIGNLSHLLVPTYPTVHLPNNLLRFYPNRGEYSEIKLHGFPLNIVSHRSGSVFSLFPTTAPVSEAKADYWYDYENEQIAPNLYQVTLPDIFTKVQFAPADK